jgi:hypothetical protein
MIRNVPASYVLLLILGFGLIAGHLPCRAQEDVQEAEMSGSDFGMACHASEAPADSLSLRNGSSASGHDCCSGEQGVCQHACHMIADVGTLAPRFAMQIAARVLLVQVSRSLSLHPQPIDHVPLS